MVRDKLTIRVITGDKISTFVFNNCVGSGSSTHDAVGQHMMVLHIAIQKSQVFGYIFGQFEFFHVNVRMRGQLRFIIC